MGDNFVLYFSFIETNFENPFVVLAWSLENFKKASKWIFSQK